MPSKKTAKKETEEPKDEIEKTSTLEPMKEAPVSMDKKKDSEEEVIQITSDGKEVKKKRKFSTWWKSLTKKKQILYLSLVGLAIVILVGLFFVVSRALGLGKWSDDSPLVSNNEATEEASVQEAPKDHELPLTGELVTKEVYDEVTAKRPLSVIIENHSDARPQSGLNDADIVWEALAEGGISRFMAVFLQNEPDKVGPVRSLRKYFLDWNAELRDGLIMHIGYAHTDNDATNALGYLYTYEVKSLGFLPNLTWRSSERYAPHNAYTSTKDLWQTAYDKGWTGIIDLDKWQFKNDSVEIVEDTVEESETVEIETTVSVPEISFNWFGYSVTSYSVNWSYDEENNTYLRSHNGVVHTDADSGDQIFAKNVVVMFVPASYTVDTDGKSRLIYELIGEGPAHIFLDGKETTATWKKSERVSRTKFYDENGDEIEFNRGRTWISVLPVGSEIEY